MFDKKKLNYWRLAAIFMGFTVITLFSLWMSPRQPEATMMNESMSSMAKMHLNNATVYDLADTADTKQQTNPAEASEHHAKEASGTKIMGIITSIIVFAFLPLLICGSIILAIVWTK